MREAASLQAQQTGGFAMPQRQLPERDELHIETPVIDMQDLEHKPAADNRVNDRGLEVRPAHERVDVPDINLADEDEKGREAIRKFEESLARMPPG
jgi:hypothetical protein